MENLQHDMGLHGLPGVLSRQLTECDIMISFLYFGNKSYDCALSCRIKAYCVATHSSDDPTEHP